MNILPTKAIHYISKFPAEVIIMLILLYFGCNTIQNQHSEQNIDALVFLDHKVDSIMVDYPYRLKIYGYYKPKSLFLAFDKLNYNCVIFKPDGRIYHTFKPITLGSQQQEIKAAGFDEQGNVMILKSTGIHFFSVDGDFEKVIELVDNGTIYFNDHEKLMVSTTANKIIAPTVGYSLYPTSSSKFYEETNLISCFDLSIGVFQDLLGFHQSALYRTSSNYHNFSDNYTIGHGNDDFNLYHIFSDDPSVYWYDIRTKATLRSVIPLPTKNHRNASAVAKDQSSKTLDYYKVSLYDTHFTNIESTSDGFLLISQSLPNTTEGFVEQLKTEGIKIREALVKYQHLRNSVLYIYDLNNQYYSGEIKLPYKFYDLAIAVNKDSIYYYQNEYLFEEEPTTNTIYRLSID